jgi:hypothetical protein
MKMRIFGKRRSRPIGLTGPTDDEIQASVENSKLSPCVVPKGMYRYRTHEANVAAAYSTHPPWSDPQRTLGVRGWKCRRECRALRPRKVGIAEDRHRTSAKNPLFLSNILIFIN